MILPIIPQLYREYELTLVTLVQEKLNRAKPSGQQEELKMVRDFLDYIMVKKTTSPDIQQEASVERKIK
jgi:hypothetical protein